MVWRRPSERVCELIQEAARICLHPGEEWLEELDRTILAESPAIADDPVLAAAVRRANSANLVHWLVANVRDPGAPVSSNLGPEPLTLARDLVRRGLDAVTLDVYRVGQNVAWRRWMEIAFDISSEPRELRELLDVCSRSISEFMGATLANVAAQVQIEHDELFRGSSAERRELVELILDGAPISRERAEPRLGYRLETAHTAAIVWSDQLEDDYSYLDRASDTFCHAVDSGRSLTVAPSAATRWVWVADAVSLDAARVEEALTSTPRARIAIGTTGRGIEGFRRSHLDALAAQHTLARLQSHQRVAFFADVKMVALIAQNPTGAEEFIKSTLGDFESASPELQTTLLAFINEQCNVSRAAKVLYVHRHTVLRRLESAQQLLPRPLDHSSVHVAVALEALQWRGSRQR